MTFERFSLSAATVALIGFALYLAAVAPHFGAYVGALLVAAVLFGVAGAITLAALIRVTREDQR